MHPAFARFVPQSASDTMTSIASNLASLAHYKLRSAYTGGSRDNLSLHRWVLLKNSITIQDVHSDLEARNAALASDTADSLPEAEADFEDEEVDSIIDEGMFAFLFPDPGDAVATPLEGSVSEEQWLDSLLETLGDEEDEEDVDLDVKVHITPVDPDADAEQLDHHSRADAESLSMSFSEEFATASPITVPYPVPYPPFHPPLNRPFELDSHDCFFASHSSPYSPYHHHDLEDPEGSVPDAIEDTSDDESDSLCTPFSRSRSSLSLVDPASVPLPRDRYEPHIYGGSHEFLPYESDALNSESTAVYSPYDEGC